MALGDFALIIEIRDAYPLPRIDDALNALSGAKYFTTLDAWTGYWQIKMNPPDAAKTGFVTRDGHYEFVVMPFGLLMHLQCFSAL
jgi:hypothetical protein